MTTAEQKVPFTRRATPAPGDRPRRAPATRAQLAAGRAALDSAAATVLDQRRPLEAAELETLSTVPDELVGALASLAHQVRIDRCGVAVSVEGILSTKTGACPEDCHFCSQSARYPTTVKATPFLRDEEILRAAEEARDLGAREFCLVLALRGPDERTMTRLEHVVPEVASRTGLRVALSAGILTADQARRLAACGVFRYNHNLETARSNFPAIVSTHTFDDRVTTCLVARAAGMEVCSGALLGVGETGAQRIELLLQLREIDPAEVPINFLNPRPGTPLGSARLLGAWDAIRWIAMFRLALPEVTLRYGGGREVTLRDLQAMGLTAGINALIIGNYLTTLGRSPDDDLAMLDDLAMPIASVGAAI